MNKLSDDNKPLHTDADHVHPDGRISRLKGGEFYEKRLGEEDDIDQRSLTLESLRDRPKSSQRDRDFVSESSLSIVSDRDLFQENSRWWSMINNSHSNNINVANPVTNASTDVISAEPNTSINNTSPHNTNNGNTTSSTIANNNSTSNNTNANNHLYNARSPTRRRSSLLSDITFESYEHISDDIDAHTTDSTDSSWANSSALLATARRFASNYDPGSNSNETIEEEHYDFYEKLKQDRDTSKAAYATTAAPVIPRRRVSKGPNRLAANSNRIFKATADADEFDAIPSKSTRYNQAALRAMNRGNAAAPTLPQRTSSHSSKLPSMKKNPMIYHMYNTSHNASYSSFVDSLVSQDTDPSFFEDGSAAAAAAAAYLSSAAVTSQQAEVGTVHTADGSDTADTPVLTNQVDGRRFFREEPLIDSETPPLLPERRESVLSSLTKFSYYEEQEDELPSTVHEEQSQDSDSANHLNNTKMSNQPPSIPLRKHSNSRRKYSNSPRYSANRTSTQHPQSRLNNQPPTCPMRKDSNHHIRRIPNAQAISTHRNGKLVPRDPSLSHHQPQSQPSHKHKPPTKPMRTNSNSISRSPTSTASG